MPDIFYVLIALAICLIVGIIGCCVNKRVTKVKIKRSPSADTRSADHMVTKEELYQQSESHISDVANVGKMLAKKLIDQTYAHDYTKIDYIDEFHKDFVAGQNGAKFKSLPWWQIHLTERHHLNDSVPDDVNLIDVLEMVIDCTVAGLARSGEVYDITIPNEVLVKAINNTKDYIIEHTEVVE